MTTKEAQQQGPSTSSSAKPRSFAWMPEAMPGVAQKIAERRKEWGDAHVTLCIRNGLSGKPGWFFAREGVIAVGTPWMDDPVMINFAALQVSSTQVLVCMRTPEAAAAGA